MTVPNPSDPQADVRAEDVADAMFLVSSRAQAAEMIRAYASRRVREELEEAARAMCTWCDLGPFDGRANDVKEIGSDGADWYHIVRPALDDSGRDTFRCEAGPIHGLLARLRDREPHV